MKSLRAALNQFFQQYSSTIDVVNGWVQAKIHPQEILILLCSRIDALASGAASEDETSTRAFTSFVTTYSGKSTLFESVSVSDVFYELDICGYCLGCSKRLDALRFFHS